MQLASLWPWSAERRMGQCSGGGVWRQAHLWYGTEIEHTVVLDSGHVAEYVWNMFQGIGDKEVETVDGSCPVFSTLEVLELCSKLTPYLMRVVCVSVCVCVSVFLCVCVCVCV